MCVRAIYWLSHTFLDFFFFPNKIALRAKYSFKWVWLVVIILQTSITIFIFINNNLIVKKTLLQSQRSIYIFLKESYSRQNFIVQNALYSIWMVPKLDACVKTYITLVIYDFSWCYIVTSERYIFQRVGMKKKDILQ